LQVVLSLGPGGTERLVVELVRRLRAELPMSVCCLDAAGAWGNQLRTEGVQVRSLHRRAGFRPTLGRQIARFAALHNARLIHCHQYSPLVYGCLARLWRPSQRVIFTEHGRLSDAPPSAKRQFANTVLSRVPHRVFAVSADLKQHLVAEGFRSNQVRVLYNGIDVGPLPTEEARHRVRQALGLDDRVFTIGTVARLDPVKDLETLIRATAALTQQIPTTLVVVGDGPEQAQLERVTAELGATSAVRFLGHRDDARDVLAGCDVFANSSISEGISLTILEAMAAGLPVVATAVGGTPEIIDASCGRLVPARSPDAMTRALHEMALSPEVRADLGRAGRRRVETRFTLERMVREYRDAYYEAAT
jgi:L-malate glycosyltransferase